MQDAECRMQTGYKMQKRYKMQTADCILAALPIKCRLGIKSRRIQKLTLYLRRHIINIQPPPPPPPILKLTFDIYVVTLLIFNQRPQVSRDLVLFAHTWCQVYNCCSFTINLVPRAFPFQPNSKEKSPGNEVGFTMTSILP